MYPLDPFLSCPGVPTKLPEAKAEAGGLQNRMPHLYRKNVGAVAPLSQAVADLLARLRREFHQSPSRVPDVLELPAHRGAGTLGALRSHLGGGGPVPHIWVGQGVRRHGDSGELEIFPTETKAVLVAWPRGTDPGRSDPARIPPYLLPVGVRLQVVLLEGAPPDGAIARERFLGRIIQ